MKTEVKKKVTLNAVPEAALEEAGLAKETILAAIPMDGVVLVTKDSMPIVELLQMLDRLNLYAAEMLTAVAAECGPCEKADEALTVEDVLEECEVTIPAWAREQAGIPENASYEEMKKLSLDPRFENFDRMLDILIHARFSGRPLSEEERMEVTDIVRAARIRCLEKLSFFERIKLRVKGIL